MPLKRRTIAVGLVWNSEGELLLCRMPDDRGVFPGQWGLPGGGIEDGETIEEGLRRELREELGIEVSHIEPGFFKDGRYEKTLPDGSKQDVYMIFLIFNCLAQNKNLTLGPEFTDYLWVKRERFSDLNLNPETIDTLKKIERERYPVTGATQ